ncbi:polyprenyl synthetase family protein [Acetoanaerobium sticklandii]|uniref:polyprenyl synthetase family protein n=1 Tax=Acetoanaerobium sticklandii TaxID=1511 RepID=UPI003A916F7A
MNFKELMEFDKQIVEKYMDELLSINVIYEKKLIESMKYSVQAGGKRLRPILFLETIKLLNKNPFDFIEIACAIEMIHTYSLIHDDLPAMDNDSLRRGKPTNHVVFGEATAILAGDGLLNLAHEIMIAFVSKKLTKNNINGINIISKAAGIYGMIAGQAVDIESEGKSIDIDTMKFIHSNKTGALIEASIVVAAVMSDADDTKIAALKTYAKYIGLAFQITDDILDIEGNEAELGKKIGSDELNDKATYPKYFGLEKSKEYAKNTITNAIESLNVFEPREKAFFVDLADYIICRKK